MTDEAMHSLVSRASEGELPGWTRAGAERREHMERVAVMMAGWARVLRLDPVDVARWKAAGHLHDALREATLEELSAYGLEAGSAEWDEAAAIGPEQSIDIGLLHGPVAAARLGRAGVSDASLLAAIAFHTTGHPGFDLLGMALFCADFLEPGREPHDEWRAELAHRFPTDPRGVSAEITGARIGYLLERFDPVHPRTVGFWNRLVRDARAGNEGAERSRAPGTE